MPKVPRSAAPPVAFSEAPAWAAVGTGWRPLFGDYRALGFSFEWHEFELATELDWARSFHPGSVELCLNLAGRAQVMQRQRTVELGPRMSAFYVQGEPPLRARRLAGEAHRFITIEFSPEFLQANLRAEAGHLHPFVRGVVEASPDGSAVTTPEPIAPALMQLVEGLRRCPVFKPAQAMWFRCKALELAAQTFFQPPEGEFFCTRQQRAACDRAARVREILAARLAEPPTLEELGRLVGCSPYYLSRQFSEATGLTIQQCLREARLDRAAALLAEGRHNVTEAAVEVGYNSLSHFTVAFRERFGCCPGLYPLRATAAGGAGKQRSPA